MKEETKKVLYWIAAGLILAGFVAAVIYGVVQ